MKCDFSRPRGVLMSRLSNKAALYCRETVAAQHIVEKTIRLHLCTVKTTNQKMMHARLT